MKNVSYSAVCAEEALGSFLELLIISSGENANGKSDQNEL